MPKTSLDSCLASQEISELIRQGAVISPLFDESRVQPSSFEPAIGEEIFILDTESGLFRPQDSKTVYRTLLELPRGQRQKVDITEGFEIKKGYSYLVRLEEKIKPSSEFKFALSSPKSSVGRIFPNTRLLTDYNASFDEVHHFRGESLEMWLLLQPLAFNSIISPGLTLNQLRFFTGSGARLSAAEVLKEWKRNPILFSKSGGEECTPVQNPTITNALQIHIDLDGKETEGIIALRARSNPMPIDLRLERAYKAEDYFEPLKVDKKGKLVLETGRHYLISSKEILGIPSTLNAELGAYSHLALNGILHRAGFVDNGFFGDLVFEVTSQESTGIKLEDGMPVGELNLYRTKEPSKLYGAQIGSHYHGQKGPKTAKYFKPFDFGFAARNYEKLDRDVLVQDAQKLLTHRKKRLGFEPIEDSNAQGLVKEIEEKGFFHSRYDCEDDPFVLQVIPYVLVFGPNETVFSYVRAQDIKDYGDARLFGKHSIGLGGHIAKEDGPNFIASCLEREVAKEEVRIRGRLSKPTLLGTLFQPDKEVDKFHFGLIYGAYTDGEISLNESSIISSQMIPIREVPEEAGYETWSRVLIPHLPSLYAQTKS
jgi:deoxycytidine triphosphate deaminase/predicted NUDIX family phosphoesterase